MDFRYALVLTLLAVERADSEDDYAKRYDRILHAMHLARRLELEAGFAYDHQEDPEFDGFRIVAYIELGDDAGQISWHLPEHQIPWDGHTTEEKYNRIHRFAKEVRS